MRGDDQSQGAILSYVSLERRVPRDHPLRPIREMVDGALRELSPRFEPLYAATGWPSIPSQRLLRALLIQILYSLRSERMLMEQLECNLLFRWFVGLEIDDPVWVPTVFTKNRDPLLEGDIAQAFFEAVLGQARRQRLLSSEPFTVDGTLGEAWASHKSFRPKGKRSGKDADDDPGNPTVDFSGQRRKNETHASTTDPEARPVRKKGREWKLSYLGNLLTENRHGLGVRAALTQATGTAEWEVALAMLETLPGSRRLTLGGDKHFDTQEFVVACRDLALTPHVAQRQTNRANRAS